MLRFGLKRGSHAITILQGGLFTMTVFHQRCILGCANNTHSIVINRKAFPPVMARQQELAALGTGFHW
jgi:hypothetical protein